MRTVIALAVSLSLLSACSTVSRWSSSSKDLTFAKGRSLASLPASFDQALSDLGLNVYFTNLHSHHFMEYRPSKKSDGIEHLGPGPCEIKGSFPQDDARPCRNDENGVDSFVTMKTDAEGQIDRLDYFREACRYAREEGKLDALMITVHTKNGDSDPDTSTGAKGIEDRHRILSEINAPYEGKFYCGLGQEASSISTGNHMNIFGLYPMDSGVTQPVFFPAGQFDKLYPQVKARNEAGEQIMLQFNHPDVRNDLWWKDIASVPKKKKKEILNDYGLDDYPPVSCLVKGPSQPGCARFTVTQLTPEMLRETFKNIRAASGDPFRMIEVISPGDATTNATTNFRSVHNRVDASGAPTKSMQGYPDGIYDYIFYLAMGFHLSPAANQDNHHLNPGTATSSRTGILAPELSEKAILTTMQERRTFASEDMNARALVYADDGAGAADHHAVLMGSELTVSPDQATIPLYVGYADPDSSDGEATLRLYYYREGDNLDFDYSADPTNVFRLALPKDGKWVLPTGPMASYSQLPSAADSVPIVSGGLVRVDLPVENGLQWVFAEITQNHDNDKVWSAPIWIRR